jgi:ribonuclease III
MRANPFRLLLSLFGGNRPGRSRRKLLSRLEKSLGYSFRDLNLLETALSHLSYINGSGRKDTESNERLEFLGDAVLDMIVAEYLYTRFLAYREGELTRIKSSIVSREALAQQASRLNLEDYILYSKESVRGRQRGINTIISNSLEAIIGAIYIDGGFGAVKKFIRSRILQGGQIKLSFDDLLESKNRLLHLTQVHYGRQPVYRVVEVKGPEHDKRYVCEVVVSDQIVGRGSGANKKDAEKQAAQQALGRLSSLDQSGKSNKHR